MNTGMRLLTVVAAGAILSLFADVALAKQPVFTTSGKTTQAPAGYVAVLHNMPGKVSKATLLKQHPGSDVLDITVALQLQNVPQLKAFLNDLHNPSSPDYRHFLTSQQFAELYGPTRDQVSALETFLTQNGIRVTDVAPNRVLVHATGTTAALERAFHVTINDYSDANGAFFSASGNPSVPASLGPVVLAVMGLDNAVMLTEHLRPAVEAPAAVTINPSPHLGPSGFSPTQIATAYGWPLGAAVDQAHQLTDTTLATGVTIAIATAYNFNMSDVSHFWAQYGLPSHTVTLVPIDGTTRRLNDETTLDIERSSAMSPGSTILVYSGATPLNQDFNDVFNKIVTDNLAEVVSTSWGSPESGSSSEAAEDQSFIQAVAEGMVVLAAAGDNGASDGAGPSSPDNADFPASDPFVVAAGGTHLVLNPNNTISSESAWTGAGGADSKEFAEPAYETASAGWVSNASCVSDTTAVFTVDGCVFTGTPTASRQSSDMSMDADPATGYSLFYNGRWAVFGGTSFVAPELAGMFAIAVAQHSNARLGVAGGSSLLFCVANGPNVAADFNDITVGSNGVNGNNIFDAATGWDHPTGWGSPKNAGGLITDIIGCVP
jgi:kumamolisin